MTKEAPAQAPPAVAGPARMRAKPAHEWAVTIQAESGEMSTRSVEANWDPEHVLTPESVAHAATAEAWWETRQQTRFAPIGVELVR